MCKNSERQETVACLYNRAVWCYIPHNDLESKFQQPHSSNLDKMILPCQSWKGTHRNVQYASAVSFVDYSICRLWGEPRLAYWASWKIFFLFLFSFFFFLFLASCCEVFPGRIWLPIKCRIKICWNGNWSCHLSQPSHISFTTSC